MQASYIPSTDSAFARWLNNFAGLIAAGFANYGLVEGDATLLSASATSFAAAFAAASTPETRTSATIAEKDAQRAAATATVRPYAVTISRNAAVSDELKIGLGVNLPNTARTPVPTPTTAPTLAHLASTHLSALLGFRDSTTPTKKAKPFGAASLELRQQLGTSPAVDPDSAPLRGLFTKAPLTLSFQSGDVGKVATIWGRWITKSGPAGVAQAGPWSPAISFGVI